MGKLIFKYGCMGSGKTAEFLMKAYHEESKGNRVWVWKPALDSRQSKITSRIGLNREVDWLIPKEENDLINDDYGEVLLLIDEAQFLTEAQVLSLREGTINFPYTVICYGLKTDFKGQLFPGAKALLESADSIIEIESSCKYCNNKAIFNMKIINNMPVFTGESIDCGGDEKYTAVCSKCYYEAKNKY